MSFKELQKSWSISLERWNAKRSILTAAPSKLTPYFPPIVANRAARPVRSRIRVVLLNVAGGNQLSVVVDCLKRPPLNDADVILLCEAIREPGARDGPISRRNSRRRSI